MLLRAFKFYLKLFKKATARMCVYVVCQKKIASSDTELHYAFVRKFPNSGTPG